MPTSDEWELRQCWSEDDPAPPGDHHVPDDGKNTLFSGYFDLLLDADWNFDDGGLKVVITMIFQIKIYDDSVKPRPFLVCPNKGKCFRC